MVRLFNKNLETVLHDGKEFISIEDVSERFGLSEISEGYGYFSPTRNYEDPYSSYEDYLEFSRLDVESWAIVNLDESGIPLNKFRWGEYYYPITIAHYGLELYGKWQKERECKVIQYMGGADLPAVIGKDGNYEISFDGSISDGYEVNGVIINQKSKVFILTDSDFRFYFDLRLDGKTERYCVHSGECKEIGQVKYLSLNSFNELTFLPSECKFYKFENLKVRGSVLLRIIDGESAAQSLLDKAVNIADWFLASQAEDGAWRSDFDHMFYSGRTEVMKSGWASALGQGLALSFLSRMYHATSNEKYKSSALLGVPIYTVPVEKGGVYRRWDSQYDFFEEYPTEPASYVLNGFIFSLLGLYDSSIIFNCSESKKLYEKGVRTLRKILPLYDLGSRSAYDLTHYTSGGYPNVARWGYHSTHVIQLNAIFSIEQDSYFEEVRDRWRSYMFEGYRCPSN